MACPTHSGLYQCNEDGGGVAIKASNNQVYTRTLIRDTPWKCSQENRPEETPYRCTVGSHIILSRIFYLILLQFFKIIMRWGRRPSVVMGTAVFCFRLKAKKRIPNLTPFTAQSLTPYGVSFCSGVLVRREQFGWERPIVQCPRLGTDGHVSSSHWFHGLAHWEWCDSMRSVFFFFRYYVCAVTSPRKWGQYH